MEGRSTPMRGSAATRQGLNSGRPSPSAATTEGQLRARVTWPTVATVGLPGSIIAGRVELWVAIGPHRPFGVILLAPDNQGDPSKTQRD